MFMGSKNAPYPSFDAIMESWGGHNNGTTSNDRTNYYEIGPRNLLETFLWLEADRLATLAEVITEEELEKQRKVVQNERRQSYENRPYGRERAAHPRGHVPRRRTPITGRPSARTPISRRPASPTCAHFFERFYRPSNASLAIAGDFEPAGRARARREVLRLAGEARGAASARAARARAGRRPRGDHAHRSRAAAAAAAVLARARAVRAGRRRPRPGGARPGRRQVEPPLQERWSSSSASPRTPSPTRARSCWAACSTSAPPPSRASRPRRDPARRRRRAGAPRRRRPDRPPRSIARATRTWPTSTRASTTCRRAPTSSTTTSTCWAIPTASSATSRATRRRRRRRCATRSPTVGLAPARRCAPSPRRAAARRPGDGEDDAGGSAWPRRRRHGAPAQPSVARRRPLPRLEPTRPTRFVLEQRARGRRRAARGRAARGGQPDVPLGLRRRRPGARGAGVVDRRHARRGRGRARPAADGRGSRAARRRPLARLRARRLAAVAAGAAQGLRGRARHRRRRPAAPAPRRRRLGARPRRPAHRAGAAARPARGGRQPGLRPHAVRRRAPLRSLVRRPRAQRRAHRGSTTSADSTPRTTAPTTPPRRRGRLRRGRAAAPARGGARRLGARPDDGFRADASLPPAPAPRARRSPGRAPEHRAHRGARDRSPLARSAGALDAERHPGRQLHEPPQLQPARAEGLHLRRGLELLVPAPARRLRGARRRVHRGHGGRRHRVPRRAARRARAALHRRGAHEGARHAARPRRRGPRDLGRHRRDLRRARPLRPAARRAGALHRGARSARRPTTCCASRASTSSPSAPASSSWATAPPSSPACARWACPRPSSATPTANACRPDRLSAACPRCRSFA